MSPDEEENVKATIREVLENLPNVSRFHFAKKFSEEALQMSGDALQEQCIRILCYIAPWRSSLAGRVREVLAGFADPMIKKLKVRAILRAMFQEKLAEIYQQKSYTQAELKKIIEEMDWAQRQR